MGSRGTCDLKPGYWTAWVRDDVVQTPRRDSDKANEKVKDGDEAKDRYNAGRELIITLMVSNNSLNRNVASAVLDFDRFQQLDSTPNWLRLILAVLWWTPSIYFGLLKLFLCIQIQAMCYHFGYFEYHGGINALSWWQLTHPFSIGEHPAWTVRVQFESQSVFSRWVQRSYYWVGRLVLGMKGEYLEYAPR